MILFPAIDLKDGRCVRLVRGDMGKATVFNDDPAAQARAFEAQGFRWLHIVDLNGAFAGRPVNAPAVEAILGAISIPAQLGGGIRDLATIETWLGKGVARVILGTVAVKNPGARARGLQGVSRVASPSASTPRAAASRSRAGRRRASSRRSSWRAGSRAAALPPSSTPTSSATACSRASTFRPPPLWRAPHPSRSSPPAVLPASPTSRHCGRPEYTMLEGAIAGRALYDGRLDAREALTILARPKP